MAKMHLVVALTSLALIGVSPASADVLNLLSLDTGGGLSYSGGTAPLTGSLAESGPFLIDPVVLSSKYIIAGIGPYTTGPGGPSDATHWFFGPGGSLSIVGEVLDSTTFSVVIPTTTLLAGSFSGTSTLTSSSPTAPDSFVTLDASIDVGVSSVLAALLGITDGEYLGSLTFTTGAEFHSGPPDPLACSLCIDELHINLTSAPEPGSWLLLGSVLGIFVISSWFLSRRRKRGAPAPGV
jgi:hypothetical protein